MCQVVFFSGMLILENLQNWWERVGAPEKFQTHLCGSMIICFIQYVLSTEIFEFKAVLGWIHLYIKS